METTSRLGLPLLAVAQAAKEMTVNEALTLLDAAVQPVVEGIASVPPPAPLAGQAWLVDAAPYDAFAGQEGNIAAWTAGGWRFVNAAEGMAVWRRDIGTIVRRNGEGGWAGGSAITLPSGGGSIYAEARIAIETIVARMREQGLIAA